MSIPAIPTVSVPLPVKTAAVDHGASTQAPARASATAATSPTSGPAQTQEAEDKPVTVHFPWLSRLSQKLEAASNRRPVFPNPVIGDNLDKKA